MRDHVNVLGISRGYLADLPRMTTAQTILDAELTVLAVEFVSAQPRLAFGPDF